MTTPRKTTPSTNKPVPAPAPAKAKTKPRVRAQRPPAEAAHPAEAVGQLVHQKVEQGVVAVVGTVVGTVATVADYAFNFGKGLIKGH